jgi:hypothetical protein
MKLIQPVFEVQLSQTLRPILKRFAGRLARYASIGLAIKKSELVCRGRPIEITRIAITDAGRRALERGAALWA